MPRQRAFDLDTTRLAALETFWQRGYHASSIQILLDAMNINRGSLYASFGPKEELFKASLDRYHQSMTAMVIALLDESPSPTQGILAMFEFTLIALPDWQRQRGCLLVNTLAELSETDPSLARHAASLLETVRAALNRALQRARDGGEWQAPQVDTGLAADLLFNFLTGLRVTTRLEADPDRVRQSVKQTLALIGLNTGDPA